MAPNQFNHLEGVLKRTNEFRVYFYDDHTKPISAAPFLKGALVEVQNLGKNGTSFGPSIVLPVELNIWKSYLKVKIPNTLKPPLYFTVMLKFEGDLTTEKFNFTF
jgi:hypothetical protein